MSLYMRAPQMHALFKVVHCVNVKTSMCCMCIAGKLAVLRRLCAEAGVRTEPAQVQAARRSC